MVIPNPWVHLPVGAPFVLPSDAEAVAEYNRRYPGFIADDLLPHPFMGNPLAPVVLLLANPGVSAEDNRFEREHPAFRAYLRSSFSNPVEGQHHAHLHEDFGSGPGYPWWTKRVRKLQEECGPLSRKLLVLQRVPYHSRKYPWGLPELPSFAFAESLLKAAVARKALIVCGRQVASWRKVLGPDAGAMIVLKNPRAAFLTPGNMPDGGYDRVVEALR